MLEVAVHLLARFSRRSGTRQASVISERMNRQRAQVKMASRMVDHVVKILSRDLAP